MFSGLPPTADICVNECRPNLIVVRCFVGGGQLPNPRSIKRPFGLVGPNAQVTSNRAATNARPMSILNVGVLNLELSAGWVAEMVGISMRFRSALCKFRRFETDVRPRPRIVLALSPITPKHVCRGYSKFMSSRFAMSRF